MNRRFMTGIAMGAVAGIAFGVVMFARRRHHTPMEQTRMMMGRSAQHAMKRARGALKEVAGRFSD